MAGRRNASGYTMDGKLKPRIIAFIDDCDAAEKEILNADDLAVQFQSRYPEYARKKRRPFVAAIQRVLDEAFPQVDDKPIVTLESDSFSEDNSNYTQYQDSNNINNSLAKMYRQTPQSQTKTLDDGQEQQISANSLKGGVARKRRKLLQNGTESAVASGEPKKRALPSLSMELSRPTTRLSDIGGCDSQFLELCKLLIPLKHPEIYESMGVAPPRGCLLHGPPGCGKTLLANAIAGELSLPFLSVAATELISGVSGESEQKIRALFQRAKENAPCLLFIDEIDAITPKRDSAQREMEKRIVAQLFACLDELGTPFDQRPTAAAAADGEGEVKPARVAVMGATNRLDSLDAALRRAGRFDREIALGIPSEAARHSILAVVVGRLRLHEGVCLRRLAKLTPGYVGADIAALARAASMRAVDRIISSVTDKKPFPGENGASTGQSESLREQIDNMLRWLNGELTLPESSSEAFCVSMGDFDAALKSVTPSAKREGFATVPDVSWDDVGALREVREQLKWAILYPIKFRAQFESLGLAAKAQGVLLCGPPGCGKTLLAKAVANETGMNFISVKGPELLNMYVGESERAVRQVFQRARNSAPCVIFFDELDALCPKRSNSESGGSSRVVNQLLTEMDGMEERTEVFLMAATNRPDIIDPAVLRPGRLDKCHFVGFPSATDRLDILNTLTKNGTRPKLTEASILSDVATSKTESFTGADLAALVREASVCALRERLTEMEVLERAAGEEASFDCVVTAAHFDAALLAVRPSVSDSDRARYDRLRVQFTGT